jgi:sulfane dehydrogenase subunit SoxC
MQRKEGPMDSKKNDKKLMQSSRRRFLKRGAALAGLAAVGAMRPARAQYPLTVMEGSLNERTDYVPDELVPKDHILRDPWTGEQMRDDVGELVVDWTGTPQWETYLKNIRAIGGPKYGYFGLGTDHRLYGVRSRFVTTHRKGSDGGSQFGYSGIPTAPNTTKVHFPTCGSPLEDQLGIITPSGLHFLDDHGEVPEIDPKQHRLSIFGMVERPLTLTMDDLMRLPSVSRIHFLDCNSNGATFYSHRMQPYATAGRIFMEGSCSEWTGVLLSTLLDLTGVKKGAKWFYASGADEYNQTWSVPIWKAMDDAMVAYGQNGEPVRPEQGYPIRLLLPGFQGTMNIKRLRTIKISSEPALHHRLYDEIYPDDKTTWFRFEHPVKSCILRPSGGQQLSSKGFYEIRGVAWSGGGKIRSVEVTVDGGKTWKDAEMQPPILSKAHTRFVFPWSWNGEETIIAARATDERGTRQPTTAEFAKFKGVDVETVKSKLGYQRFNAPQPWKIDRDGKITNAIFAI